MNFIKKNSLYIFLAVSAIGVLLAAYFEGNATMRWGQKHNEHLKSLKDAVECAIPPQVGAWSADTAEDEIGISNEAIRRVAGAEGALARHYQGSGESDVHVNITCGFSRTVGAHTPDVCFTGSGSIQQTDVELFHVEYQVEVPHPVNPDQTEKETRMGTFKTAIFSSPDGMFEQRVFWGWKGIHTGWVAPRFPRLKWNASEPICKLYVSIIEGRETMDGKEDTQKVAEKFFQAFLPEMDKILTGEYQLPEDLRLLREAEAGALDETPTAESEGQNAAGDDSALSVPSDLKTESAEVPAKAAGENSAKTPSETNVSDEPADDFLAIPGSAADETAEAVPAKKSKKKSKKSKTVKKKEEAEESDDLTLPL